MRIFLSHRSRDKALVREFRSLLPRFLDTWLDEESLSWGDSFPAELRSSIQSGVDFLIIFLDNDALNSEWVKQELKWAIEREKELKRTFVLPILLEIPRRESLRTVRDQLSAGQARLLGHVVQQCQDASEVTQREIESTMGYSHSSPELFYRLESLIAQGFLLKRRISADGQFSYRLSDDFEKEVRGG
jgi:hypothetical protein